MGKLLAFRIIQRKSAVRLMAGKITTQAIESTTGNLLSATLVSTFGAPETSIFKKSRTHSIAMDDRRIVMTRNKMKLLPILMYGLPLLLVAASTSLANPVAGRLTPGEKLTYALRWGNIPAGELQLEIRPITTIQGTEVYHFVMTAKSNAAVDIFVKIRDRIDAYADTRMTHSVFYRKGQDGDRKRKETIRFDWIESKAHYVDSGQSYMPLEIQPGSFDPLSAFYFTRLMISEKHPRVERPVTDGKRNFMGNATVIRRETITLNNGKTYDTYCLKPDLGLLGGVFKNSKEPLLLLWVTADEKRIPVQIKSKVKVGHFFGELVSTEGV